MFCFFKKNLLLGDEFCSLFFFIIFFESLMFMNECDKICCTMNLGISFYVFTLIFFVVYVQRPLKISFSYHFIMGWRPFIYSICK